MTGRFATATAVHATGGGRYDAEVFDGWDIGGNANGGYLLAIAGRAMADAAGRPPLTLTAHYLRPVQAGPVTIDVAVIRSGRRLATATATLRVGDAPALQLLGTFGEQQRGGPDLSIDAPVDLPAFDACAASPEPNEGPLPGLMANIAVRLRPGDEGFRLGRPTGRPEVAGWFALADEEPIDSIGLLLAADAFPPPVFNTDLPVAWVPTVELTVHVRGVPAAGPLRCAFRSRFIHDGLLDEEGEIWDSTGALVCQSRQLALMPRPPA